MLGTPAVADDTSPNPPATLVRAATSAPNQQQALQQLSEAQAVAEKAVDELAKAKKALSAAKGEAAVRKAAADLGAAATRVEKAQKAIEKRLADVKKAARVVRTRAAQRAVSRYPSLPLRVNADPQDPHERFLVLTPGGPLVVRAAITIDGKPFRMARERLVSEMLAGADLDEDRLSTWKEALQSRKFTMGRLNNMSDQQRAHYTKTLDLNRNGVVERGEARRFLTMTSSTVAFNAITGPGANYAYGRFFLQDGRLVQPGGAGTDLRPLLDVDDDGTLSKEEIANAGKRLKSRDADDNDLLYPQEAGTQPASSLQRLNLQGRSRGGALPWPASAALLGEAIKDEQLFQLLQQRYAKDKKITAESFAAVPELFAKLDADKDGTLTKEEAGKLHEFPAQLELTVDIGKTGKGVALKSNVKSLKVESQGDGTLSVSVPGVRIAFKSNRGSSGNVDYSSTAKSYMSRYDGDNNGYLDEKELTGNLQRMMGMWDEDGDGKVFEKEITRSYERMQAPQMTQVLAAASRPSNNSLFQALDMSGDGRLSLREMRTADKQIQKLDNNGDGRIEADEVPAAMSVNFTLGNAAYQGYLPIGNRGQTGPPPPKSNAPKWFTHMDRNGDGDVTLREFLGEREQFKKLDANSDGFIELTEAQANAK